MFSFHVKIDPKDLEYKQACLTIKSPVFTTTFEPLANLPRFVDIDVSVPKCELDFDVEDATVVLEWDEKTVTIGMNGAFGCMESKIEKTDNSLQQALMEWIEYQKEEALFDVADNEIVAEESSKLQRNGEATKRFGKARKLEETMFRNKVNHKKGGLIKLQRNKRINKTFFFL